jgi:hypothetical protein
MAFFVTSIYLVFCRLIVSPVSFTALLRFIIAYQHTCDSPASLTVSDLLLIYILGNHINSCLLFSPHTVVVVHIGYWRVFYISDINSVISIIVGLHLISFFVNSVFKSFLPLFRDNFILPYLIYHFVESCIQCILFYLK